MPQNPDYNRQQQRPVITLDYERYEKMLDDPELTETQKQELMQTLWNIVTAFIDFGFGVHPVQQVQNERVPLGTEQQKDHLQISHFITHAARKGANE